MTVPLTDDAALIEVWAKRLRKEREPGGEPWSALTDAERNHWRQEARRTRAELREQALAGETPRGAGRPKLH